MNHPRPMFVWKAKKEADFQIGSHCLCLVPSDSHEDDGCIILRGKNLHHTVRIALCNGYEEVKTACCKCSAGVHRATNCRAVWLIQFVSKLDWDMGQVALNGDRHLKLERCSSSEDSNIDHKNPVATTTASVSAACTWGMRSWSCKQRSCTGLVGYFVSPHGCQALLSNALLTRFIKVRKVGGPKILPLLILDVLLLAVFLHLLNILGDMLTYTRSVLVGANNNVLSVLVFLIRVWLAAAKTIPNMR
jgi:hypothetical protein